MNLMSGKTKRSWPFFCTTRFNRSGAVRSSRTNCPDLVFKAGNGKDKSPDLCKRTNRMVTLLPQPFPASSFYAKSEARSQYLKTTKIIFLVFSPKRCGSICPTGKEPEAIPHTWSSIALCHFGEYLRIHRESLINSQSVCSNRQNGCRCITARFVKSIVPLSRLITGRAQFQGDGDWKDRRLPHDFKCFWI